MITLIISDISSLAFQLWIGKVSINCAAIVLAIFGSVYFYD